MDQQSLAQREYCALVALNTYGIVLASKGHYAMACETLSEAISTAKSAVNGSQSTSSDPKYLDGKVTKALQQTLSVTNDSTHRAICIMDFSLSNGFDRSLDTPLESNVMYMVRLHPDDELHRNDRDHSLNLESSVLLTNLAMSYMCMIRFQASLVAVNRIRSQAIQLLVLAQELIQELSSSIQSSDDYDIHILIGIFQIETIVLHTLAPLFDELDQPDNAWECEQRHNVLSQEVVFLKREKDLMFTDFSDALAAAA